MKMIVRAKPTDQRKRHDQNDRKKRVSHHDLGGGIDRFIAFDGEGCMVNGNHEYVLLGVGQNQYENPRGLWFEEIMSFVYSQYKPKTAFTGFFLGYDFTRWFATMPLDRAAMLLTREGIAARQRKNLKPRNGIVPVHLPPHPVEYAGWQFDLLGTKRFKVRPKACNCKITSCDCPKEPWMYLCDTGGYFQMSLVNVINPEKWEDPIVTDEEFNIIVEGKMRRDKAQLDDEMRFYNRLENEILERVMREYNLGLKQIDVHLSASKWFGPGQAAQEWLKKKAPTGEEIRDNVPKWFLEAARMSYFGGWFEVFMHGIIKGITHEYDINSAYSAIIAGLPCLLHGTYSRGKGKPGNSNGKRLCLVRASVRTRAYPRESRGRKDYIGAMLHRDARGRISRPMITEGWYWLHELEAAQKAGCINRGGIVFHEWVQYIPCECPPPMRDIAGLYEHRLAVGKNSALGKAAKTVYNSGYGKFAQSVGQPIFGNSVYASLITAGCRTQILDAIATHPNKQRDVAMVATDGVYFLTPHPGLPISEKLGEWEHSEKSNLTLFKPGVYWDDKARQMVAENKTPTFKARGINAADFSKELGRIDQEFDSWASTPPRIQRHDGTKARGWPAIEFRPSFAIVSALQAIIRHDWSQAGHVDSPGKPVTQSSSPFDKRIDAWYDDTVNVTRSQPPWFGMNQGKDDCASYPYEKRFGMEDPWSEERLSANGLTPDGYVGDEYRFLVGKE
jgi:hypothetical protein